MKPITVTTSNASGGAVNSSVVALDPWTTPVNVSLGITVTGTVNFTVQYTLDDIQADGWTASTGVWWAISALTSQSASIASILTSPATAVRLVQNSGSGSTSMVVLQAGGNGSW